MRFSRRPPSSLPEVNLVPMMDVLMTVLTFFIIISMSLRGQQIGTITLPEAGEGAIASRDLDNAPVLVVGLSLDRQLLIDNQPVGVEQLTQRMQDHLLQHPNGVILLKADRALTYPEVARVLTMMRDIGGDRVSLAIGR